MLPSAFSVQRAARPRPSNSEFSTTLTLLKAIVSPAITGFSKPKAAKGMHSTL
jgi:hypothetical protein